MPAIGTHIGVGRRRFGTGGVPAGYTRTTINGNPATYLGRPVYDNFASGGSSMIYL